MSQISNVKFHKSDGQIITNPRSLTSQIQDGQCHKCYCETYPSPWVSSATNSGQLADPSLPALSSSAWNTANSTLLKTVHWQLHTVHCIVWRVQCPPSSLCLSPRTPSSFSSSSLLPVPISDRQLVGKQKGGRRRRVRRRRMRRRRKRSGRQNFPPHKNTCFLLVKCHLHKFRCIRLSVRPPVRPSARLSVSLFTRPSTAVCPSASPSVQ